MPLFLQLCGFYLHLAHFCFFLVVLFRVLFSLYLICNHFLFLFFTRSFCCHYTALIWLNYISAGVTTFLPLPPLPPYKNILFEELNIRPIFPTLSLIFLLSFPFSMNVQTLEVVNLLHAIIIVFVLLTSIFMFIFLVLHSIYSFFFSVYNISSVYFTSLIFQILSSNSRCIVVSITTKSNELSTHPRFRPSFDSKSVSFELLKYLLYLRLVLSIDSLSFLHISKKKCWVTLHHS